MKLNLRVATFILLAGVGGCIGTFFWTGRSSRIEKQSAMSRPLVHKPEPYVEVATKLQPQPDRSSSVAPLTEGEQPLREQDAAIAVRTDSISPLPDGPLVAEARELMKLPPGAVRMAKWKELLGRADYHTLVRMSELPAKPQLDEERKLLRSAALHQIGKTGELSKFLHQRAAFDSGGFSLTQVAAWEEWGSASPAESIPAWLERAANLDQPGDWATKAFAKSLLQADPAKVASGLESLDQEGKDYFYLHLGRSIHKQDPAAATAWWKMIKNTDLRTQLGAE